jgi:outer membrane protein assembly factor BamA
MSAKTATILISLLLMATPLLGDEVIVEVRFHGNFTIPDAEMARLAGIPRGQPPPGTTAAGIRTRLEQSGRFQWVRVAKRYRSMSSTDRVILLVTVKEKEPVKSKLMFLPILRFNDEYGFTYGGRFTFVDLLGAKERISFPLTWGGMRQAAAETHFDLNNPVLSSVYGGGGIHWRKNPFYRIGDLRREAYGGASRRLFDRLQFDFKGGVTSVDFGEWSDNFTTLGLDLVLDTRQNSLIPRDAVYAGVGWERLALINREPRFNRFKFDVRGYKGLFGQSVLAAQVFYRSTDGRLPDYERPFLGGASTLRGHSPGKFIGDNILHSSIELRAPLSSPRAMYRAGVALFLDTGAVYDYGTALGNADFKYGGGLSLFLFIAGYGVKVDFASDFRSSFRIHFSTGFRF